MELDLFGDAAGERGGGSGQDAAVEVADGDENSSNDGGASQFVPVFLIIRRQAMRVTRGEPRRLDENLLNNTMKTSWTTC